MKRKILAVLLAAVVLIATVAGVLIVSSENNYETMTALLYTASQRLDVQGVLLCEQVPISVPQNGAVQYVLEDGKRVAKGGEIARVYRSSDAVDAARRIKQLKNEREDLVTVQKQAAAETLSPQTLAGQLDDVYQKINAAATGNFAELPDLRRKLTRLLNYKNTNTDTEQTALYAERIAQIDAEIKSLSASVSGYTSISSPAGGYFYSNGVGHINVSKKEIGSISCDDVIRLTEQGKAAAQTSSPMLVTGYTYYFAFNIPSIQAAMLPSTNLQMIFPGSGDKAVKAEIVASNKQGGENSQTAVAVSVVSGSDNILGNSVFSAQILVSQKTGLRVPRNAIRTAKVDDEEVIGVYVMIGPIMEFRRIQILLTDGDYVICENTQKKGWLELYDEIVIRGKNLADDKIVY